MPSREIVNIQVSLGSVLAFYLFLYTSAIFPGRPGMSWYPLDENSLLPPVVGRKSMWRDVLADAPRRAWP